MKATVRVKTLVVIALLIALVAVASTLQLLVHIPGVLGSAVGLAFLIGRWSTT